MGSHVVIDQQALATGYMHWKRTVPYSNVVKRTAQTICTGYKENIVVLESGYFFDYLCHWNWFLLSLLIFNLILYIFFNSRGRVPLAGNSLRAEKSHWQVQKVTLAGPKSHTRAKMSHWSVIIDPKWAAVNNLNSVWSSTSLCGTPVGTPNPLREAMTSQWSNLRALLSLTLLSTKLIFQAWRNNGQWQSGNRAHM